MKTGDEIVRAQPAPPLYGKLHPLEREARRALSIARRIGSRVLVQLRQLEAGEERDKIAVGTTPLTKDVCRQIELYRDTLIPLMVENRRFLALKRGKPDEVDQADESEELIAAVEVMTDDEVAEAMRRRAAKDGTPP